jgi:hypothetical protein
MGKKLVVLPFFVATNITTLKRILFFGLVKKKTWANLHGPIELFIQKLSLRSQKMVWDPVNFVLSLAATCLFFFLSIHRSVSFIGLVSVNNNLHFLLILPLPPPTLKVEVNSNVLDPDPDSIRPVYPSRRAKTFECWTVAAAWNPLWRPRDKYGKLQFFFIKKRSSSFFQ